MKFALALLFTLALAMGVQSSVWPWHAAHVLHGDLNGLWDGDLHGDDGQWHGDLPGQDGQWLGDLHDGHAAAVVLGAHLAAHHSPALVVDAHHSLAHVPVVVAHPPHEGHYIAKTRGAVHSAPLAGHVASAASINLQPAPGTV